MSANIQSCIAKGTWELPKFDCRDQGRFNDDDGSCNGTFKLNDCDDHKPVSSPLQFLSTDLHTMSLYEGETFAFSAQAMVNGSSKGITYSLETQPTSPPDEPLIHINSATGVVTIYDGGEGVGINQPYTFTIDAHFGTQVIHENESVPVLEDNLRFDVADPKSITGSAESEITFSAHATEIETGQPITYALIDSVPAGATINSATGVVSWDPTNAEAGTYALTITATDNEHGDKDASGAIVTQGISTETVNVTVTDQAPRFEDTDLTSVSGHELSTIAFSAAATEGSTTSGIENLSTNNVTYALIGCVPAGASIDAYGTVTWTPTEGQASNNPYSITIKAMESSDHNAFVTETVQVTVGEEIKPSTGFQFLSTDLHTMSLYEGETFAFSAQAMVNGSSKGITYSLETQPTSPPDEPLIHINSATGVVTIYDGGEGVGINQPYTFTIDAHFGTQVIHENESVPVLEDNLRFDVADPKSITGSAESEITFSAHATEIETGQPITYALIDSVPAGATINSATGVVSWDPTNAEAGTYALTITATDNEHGDKDASGAIVTQGISTETVNVTVTDQAPRFEDTDLTSVSGHELSTIAFSAAATEGSTTSGIENLSTNNVTYALIGCVPAGASIDAYGTVTWTPTEGQASNNPYSITIKAMESSDHNAFVTETVKVTVGEELSGIVGNSNCLNFNSGDYLVPQNSNCNTPSANNNGCTTTSAAHVPSICDITNSVITEHVVTPAH